MVWQTAGAQRIFQGTTRLNTNNLTLMLLRAGTDFNLRTYTNAVSMAAVELAGAGAGYTAGGNALAGIAFRTDAAQTFIGLDFTDRVFTALVLGAGSVTVTGCALRDADNDAILATFPMSTPHVINTSPLTLNVKAPDATGVVGAYVG